MGVASKGKCWKNVKESSWRYREQVGHTEDWNEGSNIFLPPQTELSQVDSGSEPGELQRVATKSVLTNMAGCREEFSWEERADSSIQSLLNHLSGTHQTFRNSFRVTSKKPYFKVMFRDFKINPRVSEISSAAASEWTPPLPLLWKGSGIPGISLISRENCSPSLHWKQAIHSFHRICSPSCLFGILLFITFTTAF